MSNLRAWKWMDKSTWGAGPWQEEEWDKVFWIEEQTGLPCIARRGPITGSWCGYCGLPPGHPAYDKPYDDVDVEVHGGLTFGEFCNEDNPEHGICHIPEPGQPEKVFWLGFDTGHFQDLSPLLEARMRRLLVEGEWPLHYWTIDEVQAECTRLAAQLAQMTDEIAREKGD